MKQQKKTQHQKTLHTQYIYIYKQLFYTRQLCLQTRISRADLATLQAEHLRYVTQGTEIW